MQAAKEVIDNLKEAGEEKGEFLSRFRESFRALDEKVRAQISTNLEGLITRNTNVGLEALKVETDAMQQLLSAEAEKVKAPEKEVMKAGILPSVDNVKGVGNKMEKMADVMLPPEWTKHMSRGQKIGVSAVTGVAAAFALYQAGKWLFKRGKKSVEVAKAEAKKSKGGFFKKLAIGLGIGALAFGSYKAYELYKEVGDLKGMAKRIKEESLEKIDEAKKKAKEALGLSPDTEKTKKKEKKEAAPEFIRQTLYSGASPAILRLYGDEADKIGIDIFAKNQKEDLADVMNRVSVNVVTAGTISTRTSPELMKSLYGNELDSLSDEQKKSILNACVIAKYYVDNNRDDVLEYYELLKSSDGSAGVPAQFDDLTFDQVFDIVASSPVRAVADFVSVVPSMIKTETLFNPNQLKEMLSKAYDSMKEVGLSEFALLLTRVPEKDRSRIRIENVSNAISSSNQRLAVVASSGLSVEGLRPEEQNLLKNIATEVLEYPPLENDEFFGDVCHGDEEIISVVDDIIKQKLWMRDALQLFYLRNKDGGNVTGMRIKILHLLSKYGEVELFTRFSTNMASDMASHATGEVVGYSMGLEELSPKEEKVIRMVRREIANKTGKAWDSFKGFASTKEGLAVLALSGFIAERKAGLTNLPVRLFQRRQRYLLSRLDRYSHNRIMNRFGVSKKVAGLIQTRAHEVRSVKLYSPIGKENFRAGKISEAATDIRKMMKVGRLDRLASISAKDIAKYHNVPANVASQIRISANAALSQLDNTFSMEVTIANMDEVRVGKALDDIDDVIRGAGGKVKYMGIIQRGFRTTVGKPIGGAIDVVKKIPAATRIIMASPHWATAAAKLGVTKDVLINALKQIRMSPQLAQAFAGSKNGMLMLFNAVKTTGVSGVKYLAIVGTKVLPLMRVGGKALVGLDAAIAMYEINANQARIKGTDNESLKEFYKAQDAVYLQRGLTGTALAATWMSTTTTGSFAAGSIALPGTAAATGAVTSAALFPIAFVAIGAGAYSADQINSVSEGWLKDESDWRKHTPGDLMKELQNVAPGQHGYWEGSASGTRAENYAKWLTSLGTDEYAKWEKENWDRIEGANLNKREMITKSYLSHMTDLPQQQGEFQSEYKKRFAEFQKYQNFYVMEQTENQAGPTLSLVYDNAHTHAELMTLSKQLKESGSSQMITVSLANDEGKLVDHEFDIADYASFKGDTDSKNGVMRLSVIYEYGQQKKQMTLVQSNILRELSKENPTLKIQRRLMIQKEILMGARHQLPRTERRILEADYAWMPWNEDEGAAVARYALYKRVRAQLDKDTNELLAMEEPSVEKLERAVSNLKAEIQGADPIKLSEEGASKGYASKIEKLGWDIAPMVTDHRWIMHQIVSEA